MPSSIDLWLVAALGFLGSFGHCVGMCGPVAAAFALGESGRKEAQQKVDKQKADKQQVLAGQLWFHLRLNFGRLLSYVLVGSAIGALGSAVFAGGELAGVGSGLRRAIAILTGLLLVWFGLSQAKPGWLPTLPFLHPAKQQKVHERLTAAMSQISHGSQILTPVLLGLLWGLIPCGFLYAGQLRAAETQSWLGGAAVMLAFGAGTMPAMIGMGAATSLLSSDRRSQLFKMGGWITVVIGLLLLIRTGDTMSDYSGHGSLILLVLALVARPVSGFWPNLLRYRRGLGVGACLLSLLHLLHMVSHTWQWNLRALRFMLFSHQVGVWLGAIALLLMIPLTLTSFDAAQKAMGSRWRRLHLLSVPILILAAVHAVMVGSHYWGALDLSWKNQTQVGLLGAVVAVVLLLRSRQVWSLFAVEKYYVLPKSAPIQSAPSKNVVSKSVLSKSTSEKMASVSTDDCCTR